MSMAASLDSIDHNFQHDGIGAGRTRHLLPSPLAPSFLHHVDDEYSRNARSAAKRPGTMISQRAMYCQTQFSLQILTNGKINGTKNYSDKFTVLNFIPIGMGKVYIQGDASERYLCMDYEGRLYGSQKPTDECVMVEQMDQFYSTYNSYKFSTTRRKWYVALSKLGKARRGNLSRKRHKSIRFMRYMPSYDRSRFKIKPHPKPTGFATGSKDKEKQRRRKEKVDNDVRRRRAKERRRRKKLKPK